MVYNTYCTEKQTRTLILFAQNYSLQVIAGKMGVSLTTIRVRLKSLAKNHKEEHSRAVNLREVYRQSRDAIRNTKTFTDLGLNDSNDDDSGFRTPIESISDNMKRTF